MRQWQAAKTEILARDTAMIAASKMAPDEHLLASHPVLSSHAAPPLIQWKWLFANSEIKHTTRSLSHTHHPHHLLWGKPCHEQPHRESHLWRNWSLLPIAIQGSLQVNHPVSVKPSKMVPLANSLSTTSWGTWTWNYLAKLLLHPWPSVTMWGCYLKPVSLGVICYKAIHS